MLDEWVNSVLPDVAPQVAAMVELQMHVQGGGHAVERHRPVRGRVALRSGGPQEPVAWSSAHNPAGPQAQAALKPSPDRGASAYLFSHRGGELGQEGGRQGPHSFPLQIRHSRGAAVRKKYGLDAAQVALGQARADATEVYAEKNLELAIKIAKEMG